MHPKVCKGSKEELKQKIDSKLERLTENQLMAQGVKEKILEGIENNHYRERYIIYDFETDTSTSIHRPNHVEIDILERQIQECHMSTKIA
jgi:plasmid stabilization system protein ParE